MTRTRHVAETVESEPTMEGAGVKLRRAFGAAHTPRFDPFLMLDDFRGETPQDYEAGFPWHPHRGIETITYMLEGSCVHGDSMGNSGVIGPGDVQWMTAGSGIIHQEMPAGDATGRMGGFQLWANLPAADKMMDARYRGIEACDIPDVEDGGAAVRVVAGKVGDTQGPVDDVVTDPEYLDVTLAAGMSWHHATSAGHTAFAYVTYGEIMVGEGPEATRVPALTTALLTDGDEIVISAGENGTRFLLISGKPLASPSHGVAPS